MMKNLEEFYFDLSDRIFLPGGTLSGKLLVNFDKSVEINYIKISLKGEGRGKWLNEWKRQNGFEIDDSSKPLDLENILSTDLVLFGAEDGDVSIHEHGKYLYEFNFQLTKDLPITFKGPKECDLGVMKYHVIASVIKPNKADVLIKKPVVINETIHEDYPGLLHQPSVTETKKLNCCNGGKGYIKIDCSLKQPCYTQNESLIISNYVENVSKSVVVPFAKLVKVVKFKNKFYMEDIHEVSDKPLEANSWANWDEGEFIIPLVGPTCTSYDDIKVTYFVRVGVHKKYGGDVYVDLPVIIGSLTRMNVAKHSSVHFIDDLKNVEKYNWSSDKKSVYRANIKERID